MDTFRTSVIRSIYVFLLFRLMDWINYVIILHVSSQDDRSLINLHLMHTSYFLFVMVITMFCYAVIKGRPGKVRQTNTDFCPEKVQPTPAVLYDMNR